MENIKFLVEQDFKLFNVNDKKVPINKKGKALENWIELSSAELKQEHNYNSLLWGMCLGKQDNGKFILSLDFDCCGKKNKLGERVGCDFTKQKLQEWRELSNSNDGMYSSSTDGNFNVLIDYTNCPDLIQKVRELNKAKFAINDLEVLLGGNQVIPPSATISKITKVLGNPRTFLGDVLFYELLPDTETYRFVSSLFPTTEIKKKEEKQNQRSLEDQLKTLKKKQENDMIQNLIELGGDNVSNDKYVELLFDVIGNKNGEDGSKIVSWDDWFHICGMLKSNNFDENLFIKYSLPFSTEFEIQKLWNGSNRSLSIYGLQNLAKKYNPEGYKNWLLKHNIYISYRDIQSYNDVALWSSKFFKNDLIYSNGKWYKYNIGLWEVLEEPMSYFVSIIQNKIKKSIGIVSEIIKKNDDEIYQKLMDKYNKFYVEVCQGKCVNQLTKFFMNYLRDDNFETKLDKGLYKMVFKNGIWDLTTFKFRKGLLKEDYLTKTIPWNWEEIQLDKKEFVKICLKKICNWNDKHLEYYLSSIGYALTSDSDKVQGMWYFRGQTASNGKSLIFEVLSRIIPNYCIKQDNTILDQNADNRKKMAKWKGLKILWLDELTENKKDESLIKNIANGTPYEYDELYSKKSVSVDIGFKLFCVSEYSINIKANNGFDRRFNLCQFNSKFDDFEEDNFETREFKKNTALIDLLCNDYKFEILHLLMEYAHKFYINKKLEEYPTEWSEEKKQDIGSCDIFKEWFEEYFDINENGYCYRETFDNYLKQNKILKDFTKKAIKDSFVRLKINASYDSTKKLKNGDLGYEKPKNQGFWKGFVLKEDYKEDLKVPKM